MREEKRASFARLLILLGSLFLFGVSEMAFAALIQGGSVTLTVDHFNLADPDGDYSLWIFTVIKPPVNGSISVNGKPTISTFTYNDIENELVVYQHDDSETTSDSFIIEVSDGDAKDQMELRVNIVLRVIFTNSFE